jgi:hypothetical protein
MKRLRIPAELVAVLLVLTVACATVGTGDPLVVRAEDTLTNSLSVFQAAMNQHFANSTKESPSIYKAMEDVRVKFPIAWQALYNAEKEYRLNRDPNKLNAAISAIETIIRSIPGGA